jgi:hypothetical protein
MDQNKKKSYSSAEKKIPKKYRFIPESQTYIHRRIKLYVYKELVNKIGKEPVEA